MRNWRWRGGAAQAMECHYGSRASSCRPQASTGQPSRRPGLGLERRRLGFALIWKRDENSSSWGLIDSSSWSLFIHQLKERDLEQEMEKQPTAGRGVGQGAGSADGRTMARARMIECCVAYCVLMGLFDLEVRSRRKN